MIKRIFLALIPITVLSFAITSCKGTKGEQDPKMELSIHEVDVPSDGGEFTVDVKSTAPVSVDIAMEHSWIERLLDSKADDTYNTNATYRFRVHTGLPNGDRVGQIVFQCKTVYDTVYVRQAQKDTLGISDTEFHVPFQGGTYNFVLRSNLGYTYEITNNASSWISIEETKAYEEKDLTLVVAANSTAAEREADVIFYSEDRSVSRTLHIKQDANNFLANTTCGLYFINGEYENFILIPNERQYAYTTSADGSVSFRILDNFTLEYVLVTDIPSVSELKKDHTFSARIMVDYAGLPSESHYELIVVHADDQTAWICDSRGELGIILNKQLL